VGQRNWDGVTDGILDRFSLAGRVAVVTGASSGLGVGFALALADAGADVVLAARRLDRAQDVAARIEATGRRALAVRTDVTRPEDCTALAQATVEAMGRLDVLVNNAGVGTAVPALRETPEEFRDVIEVNLLGAYWMAQACARVMAPGSSIVNVASILGLVKSWAPQAAYAASKAGLIGLTRDLANQWSGRKGIRVNALAPGYFASEMTDQIPADMVEGFLTAHSPLGRIGQQVELDAALVFLASPASSYITGVTLPVDGGIAMP
jgi:NAD(P)-dependent dehydrogenase (short-subunit alcohol dehydrogenase family)